MLIHYYQDLNGLQAKVVDDGPYSFVMFKVNGITIEVLSNGSLDFWPSYIQGSKQDIFTLIEDVRDLLPSVAIFPKSTEIKVPEEVQNFLMRKT